MVTEKSTPTPLDAMPEPDRTHLAAQLRAGYENGQTVRTLAESTGRSYGLIHRLLVESGVTMRPRGSRSGR